MKLDEFVNKYNGLKVDFDNAFEYPVFQERLNLIFSKYEINEIWFSYYIKFLNSRKLRKLEENSVFEKHHILPKCLFQSRKLSEFKENIINLTPREHWIAHLILYKTFPSCFKLATAAVFMGITRNEINFNSKKHQQLVLNWRKRVSEVMKISNLKRKEDPHYHDKLSETIRSYYESHPETKVKISNSVKNLWKNKNYRDKTSKSIRKSHSIDEFRLKLSESVKNAYKNNPNLSKNLREKQISYYEVFEHVKEQSNRIKNAWKDPIKRKNMNDSKKHRWDSDESLRKKQSEILKESHKKPKNRLSFAKGRVKFIDNFLKKNPGNEIALRKRKKWLIEINNLTKEIEHESM